MPAHRIHLRGPWDFTWLEQPEFQLEPLAKTGTVAMPLEWRSIFGDVPGAVQFRRKFHRPTNLDPNEMVMIVFTEIRGSGEVFLNDHSLGSFQAVGGSVEFEMTPAMNSFNELKVQIKFDPQSDPTMPGGLFGVAAIEIRSE